MPPQPASGIGHDQARWYTLLRRSQVTGQPFDGKPGQVQEDCALAKLGTSKRPAVVRVQSLERGEEIVSLCNEHGWQVIVGVEEDEPEDVSDVDRLLGGGAAPSQTVRREPKVGRNAPCPCGSGRKFKNCCGPR